MTEQLHPDYYFYLPADCPSRGGIHATLRTRCVMCGWVPPSGMVGLDTLMELGDALPYKPKHRRAVFRDRWRRGRRGRG